MAWHQHKIKSLKQAQKRRRLNSIAKRKYKNANKKLLYLIEEKDLESAKEFFPNLQGIDQTIARKGVIHKNKAARNISRLKNKLNNLEKELSNSQTAE